MQRADQILKQILRETRVVQAPIVDAVHATAREFWPTLRDGEVEVRDFKRGVLHVVLSSHARMAEAKSFLSEDFRRRVNGHLESNKGSGRRPTRGETYVSKLVFHVRGTF